jgi:hypothetical protein
MKQMRPYEAVVEEWIREFYGSMAMGILQPGNDSGSAPLGVKIIFDGYGYNEETNTEDDLNSLSFAVFVHKDSLSGKPFPEHEQTPFGLIHRLAEEVCIYCWYGIKEDEVDVVPFENGDTKLEHQFVYELIDRLDRDDYDKQ